MMIGNKFMALTTAASLVAIGLPAALQAAIVPISIANAGFDDQTISSGQVTPTSWAAISGGSVGVAYDPSTTQLTGGAAKNGLNVGGLAPGQSLSQTLTTDYAASTKYTLSFYVAQRLDLGFAGYDAQFYAGTTLLKEISSGSSGAVAGSFSDAINLVFSSPSSVTASQKLRLVFLPTVTSNTNTPRTVIDAISLTSEVPEPASLSALAVIVGASLRRRRRMA